MSAIRYRLEKKCLEDITDDDTKETYKRGIRKFETFLLENKISQRQALRTLSGKDCVTFIQNYCDWLVEKNYTAATVHTYLSPVAKACGVNLASIDKPPRISAKTTKGRSGEKNRQGKRDLENEKYKRITEFAAAVGIRRSEYAKLTGKDILYDAVSGKPIGVRVISGKGGKDTINYILPQHQDTVARIVSGIADDQKIFSREEMKTRADLHQFRRKIAVEAYDYYSHLPPDDLAKLKQELIEIYCTTKKGVTPEKITRFKRELDKGDYVLRGANAEKARLAGRPVRYSRVGLFAVSILNLSHFRNDVTVNHYLQ
ncbi:MAG: hypothetical protein LUH07_02425 [Lachnospiraceae bacterium]|nr:hypothetical protein [Lachnospiraceae bacterium]